MPSNYTKYFCYFIHRNKQIILLELSYEDETWFLFEVKVFFNPVILILVSERNDDFGDSQNV